MQVQVNTDRNIQGSEDLSQRVEDSVNRHLDRFSEHATRAEVYLTDQNSSAKGGSVDIRCQLEVRLAGRDPLSVTDNAAEIDQAVNGAAQKMVRLLETTLGKLNRR
jgi:hypothetical protein